MDFDKVYQKSLTEKFPLEVVDSDFRNDNWIAFRVDGTPESYTDETGEEHENLTGITVYIEDVDPEWSYEDGSFYEDFGLGPERCDSGSGYILENVNCETSSIFDDDGSDISVEEFARINEMTIDEAEALRKDAEDKAVDEYYDWAKDNLEHD